MTPSINFQELIESLRTLKQEVKTQREETMLLRKALEDCEACKIKKPECTDLPYPCFKGPPRVDCRDTVDGVQCGPCPPGYKVPLLPPAALLPPTACPGRRPLLRAGRLRRGALFRGGVLLPFH